MEKKKVLAMYDIRGIQKYVFRTPKIKDAIGASAIVEHVIREALDHAVKKLSIEGEAELEWYRCESDDSGREKIVPLPYEEDKAEHGMEQTKPGEKKLQVLYIGGGNAVVICESRELCVQINRIMSKYVIEKTYSLQLAAAMVLVTKDYQEDYRNLRVEMDRVKAKMLMSKPLGALPVMEIEIKTGYPAVTDGLDADHTKRSTESILKVNKEKTVQKQRNVEHSMKILDNYVTKKGTDSTLAVVHIDGNNMGLRIRGRLDHIREEDGTCSYEKAVMEMREMSANISTSYTRVFDEMQQFFNAYAGNSRELADKDTKYFVLKVLTAGDDITYVCNGKIAIATVEYFCREISKCKMTEKAEATDPTDYSFSVCAGIAYIGSHFPFSIGYDVAEACCENAKTFSKQYAEAAASKSADEKAGKEPAPTGCWLDYQICKNIQTRDLEGIREKEYITSLGEQLYSRPYFVATESDKDRFKNCPDMDQITLDSLKKKIIWFLDERNIPRSFAKGLRNIYSQGEDKAKLYMAFLESRKWELQGHSSELYYDRKWTGGTSLRRTAIWYDALELLDYYADLDDLKSQEEAEGGAE